MNKFFLHHAIVDAEMQFKNAGLTIPLKIELVNVAIQLKNIELLETISHGLIDVESELQIIRKYMKEQQ